MTIAQNYGRVRAQVDEACRAAGRDPQDVTLVAVSKTVPVDQIAHAVAAGAADFGENRPERLVEAQSAYPQQNWHFIGNVQGRRIGDIVPRAALVHSVCQAHHLPRIQAAAQAAGKVQRILLEVNVSGEASKGGAASGDVPALLEAAAPLDCVQVCGLMTMAPQGSAAAAQATFSALRELAERLGGARAGLTELSMGMSEDWPLAVAEGATIVRVGRAIFSEQFA